MKNNTFYIEFKTLLFPQLVGTMFLVSIHTHLFNVWMIYILSLFFKDLNIGKYKHLNQLYNISRNELVGNLHKVSHKITLMILNP